MNDAAFAAFMTYCVLFVAFCVIFTLVGTRVSPARLAAGLALGPALLTYAWMMVP